MNKLLLILLLTIPFIGFGQGWEKTFGGSDSDGGYSVQQTTDGGYIITGRLNISSWNNIYLIKTDGNGDSLWTNNFGDIEDVDDNGYSVQQTTDGGYIITGTYSNTSNSTFGIHLIKTDGFGNEQWSKTFGGNPYEEGYSVQQTTDGGYIITGYTESFGNGKDVYLIKTDDNGDSLWTKTFGGNDYEFSYSVQQTTDGGYIITGYTQSYGNGNSDVYLIKTDGFGNEQWTQTFGGTDSDKGKSVQQTTDGGYIITGYTQSFGNGGYDVWLIKTDGNGDSLWTKTFGGSNNDKGKSVQQTNDGGYIITGYTQSFGIGPQSVYLIKTDDNGDSLWTKTFVGGGGGDGSQGNTVQQTTDGGYIITGYTDTDSFGNGSLDVYLIKTDGNGTITSTFNIPTPSSNRKLERVVDLLGRETKPQPHTPFIEIYDDGSTDKKLIIEK